MRRLALLFALLLVPPARAAEFDPKPIDEVVEKAMKEFGARAAVVVVRDGEVIYLKGFGVREKGKPEKVTPDTVFPIASCSKAFTATALRDARRRGEADVGRQGPRPPRLLPPLRRTRRPRRDAPRPALPPHRDAAARPALGRPFGDTGDVIRRWGKGEAVHVVPLEVGVLQRAVHHRRRDRRQARQAPTGPASMQTRIFKPLGMKRQQLHRGRKGIAQRTTRPRTTTGSTSRSAAIKWDEIDHAGGAGCVNSTARDMAAWLQFQLAGGKFDGKRLLTEKAPARDAHAADAREAGGAVRGVLPARRRRGSSATGWAGSSTTTAAHVRVARRHAHRVPAQCMLVPEKKLGVFVLCNLRPSLCTEAVAKTVLDRAPRPAGRGLGQVPQDALALLDAERRRRGGRSARATASRTRSRASRWRATPAAYDEPAYGRAEVADEGGKLVTRGAGSRSGWSTTTSTRSPRSRSSRRTRCSFDRSTFDVQFRLGTNGEVEGMKFLDQDFRRAKK